MTTIRLAIGGSHHALTETLSRCGGELTPGILCSYVYLDIVRKYGATWKYRDWVLDSGAFSVWNKGKEIRLQDYVDACKALMDTPRPPVEIYALDVIGDWRASLRNCELMWKQGIEAIPCYHAGEPQAALIGIAKDYPKIAIGGISHIGRGNKRFKWLEQCFARVWPKCVHGFGVTTEKWLTHVPWHSVDSTSWQLGPLRYGQWGAFGNARLAIRGGRVDMRAEVAKFMALEKRLKSHWFKEMREAEAAR